MNDIKIIENGVQKDVKGLFYIYESKYYFIYTEREIDENNYVILYMTQVGKETKNTENGPVETGYMVGLEISDPQEQQNIQTSISYIVEDKKNNTQNPKIQYLPMNMLSNLKIVSKKRFRLLKSILEDNFKVSFADTNTDINEVTPLVSSVQPPNIMEPTVVQPVVPTPAPIEPAVVQPVVPTPAPIEPAVVQPVVPTPAPIEPAVVQPAVPAVDTIESAVVQPTITEDTGVSSAIIVDYRTKYFEEEEKNEELQKQVEELTRKLEEIKKIVE